MTDEYENTVSIEITYTAPVKVAWNVALYRSDVSMLAWLDTSVACRREGRVTLRRTNPFGGGANAEHQSGRHEPTRRTITAL